ncbi:MAG: group II intron maturase-specific domain-containing protein [Granulosicoccus sp.]
MPKRSDKSIEDISSMFRATIQGWINYFGRFYRSQMYMTLRHINSKLVWWAMRKYKKLHRHRRRAQHWIERVAEKFPSLFPHWQIGLLTTVGEWKRSELRGSCCLLRGAEGVIPFAYSPGARIPE